MIEIEPIERCFVEDDGSLPGIELKFGNPDEVPRVYEFLVSRSTITTPNATYWDEQKQCDVRIDTVPHPAMLVARGFASHFHHCVAGLSIDGTVLPELGVFVFKDSIEIDYRMGPEWTRNCILAFLELIHRLHCLAPSAELSCAVVEEMPASDSFLLAWREYHRQRSDHDNHGGNPNQMGFRQT
jgi:hypothetical protein